MKLLLTSAGVKNASIHKALVDLLGKPIADSSALCIPTAQYAHPNVSPEMAWRFVSGQSRLPMVDLGWKSVGVLELTALPSIGAERWVPWVREADVLLASRWRCAVSLPLDAGVRAGRPPAVADEKVWVGLSAGSMVMTPRIGEDFVEWKPPPDDETLGVVDFSICPHVNPEGTPGNTMAEAESWAAGIDGPGYAIDDETAIRVTDDGNVDVVSEGHWTLFS